MANPVRMGEPRKPGGSGPRRPVISVVLATHNRCAVIKETLTQLGKRELSREDYEIIVVDNASTDGTPRAIAGDVDLLVELRRNRGSCAKAYGAERARGRYIVFLDDDSCPRVGSLSRMIARFEQDATLGAVGFTVHLPDGSQEGGALAGVFVGCGVGFRAAALREVGGLDASFFMQAEEYDVCFRLAGSGWKVDVFDDLHVDHRKTVTARRPARTTYFDIRNNLRVLARYAPVEHYGPLREDCIVRYGWLAAVHGHEASYQRGLRAGRRRAWFERFSYCKKRLSDDLFERFYRWDEIERRMSELVVRHTSDECCLVKGAMPKLDAVERRHVFATSVGHGGVSLDHGIPQITCVGALAGRGVKRIVLADLGKNVFGFWRAARRIGIGIAAIGDDRFAAVGRRYRGIAVLPLAEALRRDADAVVVSNSSPVHANSTARRARMMTPMPVFSWFGGRVWEDDVGLNFGPPRAAADNTREQALDSSCP